MEVYCIIQNAGIPSQDSHGPKAVRGKIIDESDASVGNSRIIPGIPLHLLLKLFFKNYQSITESPPFACAVNLHSISFRKLGQEDQDEATFCIIQ